MKGTDDADRLQSARPVGGPMLPIEAEVARGLRFMHLMAMAAQRQDNETERLVEELSKLLMARRIMSEAEWEEASRKQNVPDVL